MHRLWECFYFYIVSRYAVGMILAALSSSSEAHPPAIWSFRSRSASLSVRSRAYFTSADS